jgi:RNA polymerase sigma factor (sigma-70 family)
LTEDGFASFFRERFARTVVLLIAMGASRADAEDATQEAMIRAWQQWESIREPTAWVRTVAVRTYCKLVSQRQSRTTSLDEATGECPADPDLSIFTEEQQHVLRLLRALPTQQRVVAALSYDDLTCEEIAELTGKSSATIRSHLRHARKTLRGMVLSEGHMRPERGPERGVSNDRLRGY